VTWGSPHAERAAAARSRRLLPATAREIIAGQGRDRRQTAPQVSERPGRGRKDLVRRVCRPLSSDSERGAGGSLLTFAPR